MSAAWGTREWTLCKRSSRTNRAVCTKVRFVFFVFFPLRCLHGVVLCSDALSVYLVLGPHIFTPYRSFSLHCAPFGPTPVTLHRGTSVNKLWIACSAGLVTISLWKNRISMDGQRRVGVALQGHKSLNTVDFPQPVINSSLQDPHSVNRG